MMCSECQRPTRTLSTLTCSDGCAKARRKKLRREYDRNWRAAQRAAREKDVPPPDSKPCPHCGQLFAPRPDESTRQFDRRTYCSPECQKARERQRSQDRDRNPAIPFTPQSVTEKREELQEMLNELPPGSIYHEYALERLERFAA
jgi:hypothetical protein